MNTSNLSSRRASLLNEFTIKEQLTLVRILVPRSGFNDMFEFMYNHCYLSQSEVFDMVSAFYVIITGHLPPYSSFGSFIATRNKKIKKFLNQK